MLMKAKIRKSLLMMNCYISKGLRVREKMSLDFGFQMNTFQESNLKKCIGK